MRNNVNEDLLASRAKWARTLSFGGLGCLIAAVVLVNRELYLAWAILTLGLVVSTSGAYLATRYIREPRAEQALAKALSGFDDHHVLYNFLLPEEHVLVTPSGVWVILVKKQPGELSYDGRKWRRKFTLSRLFGLLGEPGLGNPIRELNRDVSGLSERIAHALGGTEVPVEGVIVFTDPGARIDIKRTACPVVTVDNLRSFFRRELKNRPAIDPEVWKALVGVLDNWAG